MTASKNPQTRALETAFWDIVAVWRAGGRVDLQGRSLLVQPAGAQEEAARLRQNTEAAKDILVGSRKAWAQDLVEAVIDVELRDDAVQRVAGVVLSQRRLVQDAFLIDLCRPDGHAELGRQLGRVNGLVLRQLNFSARAAVGEMLGRAKAARSCQIVEMTLPEDDDYRQFIAGSFWLDMDLNLGRADLFGHALLRTLQVRSIRSTALKTHKMSFFIGSAVKKLHKDGHHPGDISVRTGVPEAVVRDWTGAPAGAPVQAGKENTARQPGRPATDKQKAKAGYLINEVPAFSHLFPEGWQDDIGLTSAAIATAMQVREQHGTALARLRQERKARSLVAGGRSLGDAAEAAGLGAETLSRALARDMDVEMKRLAGEIGQQLGRAISPHELLPADG